MRHVALATDYDGTLAHHGVVADETILALERLRQSGRRVLLVTGREMHDLHRIFPRLDLFHRIVAENGAVLYDPESRTEKLLTDPPNEAFVQALRDQGVDPLWVGRAIVATVEPHDVAALAAIRELGLELQVTFNKGSIMVLPSGVNKASGLARALEDLGLSSHNVVAVGDAENDHAFLAACGCAVAVANALPSLQARADLVTAAPHGLGVIELIDRMIANDLAGLGTRHTVLVGTSAAGDDERIDPLATSVLVAGTSGSGKSTLTTGILERLADARFQYAIIDPEGDYTNLPDAVVIGDPQTAPTVAAVIELLRHPSGHAVVNLLGIPLEDRPAFFNELLPHLLELRQRTGRPHLVVVDEAHHLLPADRGPRRSVAPPTTGMLYITVHPESVAPDALAAVGTAFIIGQTPSTTLTDFCRAAGHTPLAVEPRPLEPGEVLVWHRGTAAPPRRIQSEPPVTERRRHVRKYAEGNLGPDRNFVFSGPHGKLNLRAQNLTVFLQMADGVDDDTWQHHLGRGDYSAWFRKEIKDEALANEAADAEGQAGALPAATTRATIRDSIQRRYTLPADKASGEVSREPARA